MKSKNYKNMPELGLAIQSESKQFKVTLPVIYSQ